MTIYISMPIVDKATPEGNSHFHQLAYQTYKGLQSKLGESEVVYVPRFDLIPPFDESEDWLICDWTRLRDCDHFPRNRVILVDNSNFDSQKKDYSQQSYYTKYGLQVPIDSCPDFESRLKGVPGALYFSNDVAINKWNTNHPDVLPNKQSLQSLISKVEIMTHPVDKQYWSQWFDSNQIGRKLLIYHNGGRKNSYQYIELLMKMGYSNVSQYNVVDHIEKTPANLARLNKEYFGVVNCSFSESGPANMIEYLFQGLLVIGCEEWWSGYGEPRTVWTYDPTRRNEMENNIRWLMNPANLEEIKITRNRIHNEHMTRIDNDWSYCVDKLFDLIEVNKN